MSERGLDTLELLASPRGIQKRRGRHKNDPVTAGYLSEGGAAAMKETDFQSHDDAHSYISDQGLPSERARLAASNHYRELQRSGREEERSGDERTPLLASLTKESAMDDSRGAGEPPILQRFGATKTTNSCEPVPRVFGTDLRTRVGAGPKKKKWFKRSLEKL